MSSCRHSRELVELFRYGAPDERSEGQLRHLGACDRCRDEIGFDRQLVRALQDVLHARVAGAAPSPAAWAAIRREAELQRARPRWGWLGSLAAISRGVGGAAAVSALAVVLIVFGGQRPVTAPLDTGTDAEAAAAARGADVADAATISGVPAERLEAPSRPSTAQVEMELVLPETGKRASEPSDEQPEPPVDDRSVARGPGGFLQGEVAPEFIVAAVVDPAPSPQPGGNPL